MSRQHYNYQGGQIDTQVDTTAGGAFLLSSPGLANLPAIAAGDTVTATLDPDGINGAPETVDFTAHPSSNLAAPNGLTVTPTGTAGTTTYGYRVSAIVGNGETVPCAEVTTTTGNAALTGVNYNALAWTAVTGATGYKIYGRTAAGELYMATVTTNSYNDTGVATPGGAMPTVSTAITTMATFTAAREGSSGRVHQVDEYWVHGPTAADLPLLNVKGMVVGATPPNAVTPLIANTAFYARIFVPFAFQPNRFCIDVNGGSGNFDQALYPDDGTGTAPAGPKIASTGSTAMIGSGVQATAVTCPVLAPGVYWMAVTADNGSANLGYIGPGSGAGRAGAYLAGSAAQGIPLPSTPAAIGTVRPYTMAQWMEIR